MKLHRSQSAIKRYGTSAGSWDSECGRWHFDREGRTWMILPKGSLGGPLDLFLETNGLGGQFPTRRKAIQALESALAEGSAPTLAEADAKETAEAATVFQQMDTEELLQFAKLATAFAATSKPLF